MTKQVKSIPGTKSEETPETESPQKRKTSEVKKSPLLCSLNDRVIRVLSKPAPKASAPHEKSQQGKATNTNPKFRIFHNKEKKSSNADITGARALTTWKKGSGRSKSWTVCQRLKLPREDLELLVQPKTRPISLGWQFSDVISPVIFVRRQGVRVYKQSENKTKSSSRRKYLMI